MKGVVANAPSAHNIPVVQIESKTTQIDDVVEFDINERLKESFGVSVSGIDIGAIEIDKSSDGFRQLISVTRDLASATAKAENETRIKDIVDNNGYMCILYDKWLEPSIWNFIEIIVKTFRSKRGQEA